MRGTRQRSGPDGQIGPAGVVCVSASHAAGALTCQNGIGDNSARVVCRKHGFFHADPHPGNIAVDSAGNLVFYDFGMMGEIKADVRENLLEVFYGVYDKDADRVLDALITLGVLRLKAGDRISLRRFGFSPVDSPVGKQ